MTAERGEPVPCGTMLLRGRGPYTYYAGPQVLDQHGRQRLIRTCECGGWFSDFPDRYQPVGDPKREARERAKNPVPAGCCPEEVVTEPAV